MTSQVHIFYYLSLLHCPSAINYDKHEIIIGQKTFFFIFKKVICNLKKNRRIFLNSLHFTVPLHLCVVEYNLTRRIGGCSCGEEDGYFLFFIQSIGYTGSCRYESSQFKEHQHFLIIHKYRKLILEAL